MTMCLECLPCIVRQAAEAINLSSSDSRQNERLLKRLLREIADADWDATPVSIAQRMQRLIRETTGQADPYRALKDRMNRTALDLLPALADRARHRPDSRETATRLALAGNLLDAGAKVRLAPEDLAERLKTLWDMPLVGRVEDLFAAADAARTILYLADNAGEIVFDRLLIEALPSEKVTVAVRGIAVINDATLEDAETAGLTGLVRVVDNGSDAPGTLVEDCSEEFRNLFDRADLIIAKGQGNYETLSESRKNIFFLFAVKCPLVAMDSGAPVGTLVIKQTTKGETPMIIAIPLTDGKLSAHFGHCEAFALFDVDEAAKTIVGRQTLVPPAHEPGVLPRWLHERGAAVIIAGGMGQRAQSLFSENDIQVVVGTAGHEPEQIVQQYLEGTLACGVNVCDH